MLRLASLILAAVAVAACQSKPVTWSETAPDTDLSRYGTYAFMEKLSTDGAGYTSITTQRMKQAVARELAARGLRPSEGAEPDLLVNLIAVSKDKIRDDRDPRVGVSYGHGGWARRGWGVGVGLGGGRVRSVREDTLTVDLVDRARNVLVWTGSASFTPTLKERSEPEKRITDAVARIFRRYPGSVQVAEAK